jgi:hypothetical protein
MPFIRALLCGAVLLSVAAGSCSAAEGQQTGIGTAPPTFRVTSNLVFLDVTVLDKKGRPALPYKLSAGKDWIDQRLSQSIEALQQIALQNKGLPGRKNILWIGNGGPSIAMDPADPRYAKSMRFYALGRRTCWWMRGCPCF